MGVDETTITFNQVFISKFERLQLTYILHKFRIFVYKKIGSLWELQR